MQLDGADSRADSRADKEHIPVLSASQRLLDKSVDVPCMDREFDNDASDSGSTGSLDATPSALLAKV